MLKQLIVLLGGLSNYCNGSNNNLGIYSLNENFKPGLYQTCEQQHVKKEEKCENASVRTLTTWPFDWGQRDTSLFLTEGYKPIFKHLTLSLPEPIRSAFGFAHT